MYIGQASDSEKDQILEEAEMDDIQPGQMKFVFEVTTTLSLNLCTGTTPRRFEDPRVGDRGRDRHLGDMLVR